MRCIFLDGDILCNTLQNMQFCNITLAWVTKWDSRLRAKCLQNSRIRRSFWNNHRSGQYCHEDLKKGNHLPRRSIINYSTYSSILTKPALNSFKVHICWATCTSEERAWLPHSDRLPEFGCYSITNLAELQLYFQSEEFFTLSHFPAHIFRWPGLGLPDGYEAFHLGVLYQ